MYSPLSSLRSGVSRDTACAFARRPAIVASIVLLAGCTGMRTPSGAVAPGSADERGQVMVSERLYFGRNIPAGGTVSDSAFAAFMADVVTPRFPNGLTVFQAVGQWTDPHGTLVHESTTVVQLDHPPGAVADSIIAAIADSFLVRFHQDAVLRITDTVLMRFYRPHPYGVRNP
jgi:hypothetical protein